MSSQVTEPNADEMKELQKTFSDAVVRTNRFVVSTLIILLILGIVIAHELREYRREERRLNKDIEAASKNLDKARHELDKTSVKIRHFLRESGHVVIDEENGEAVTVELQLQQLPKPITRAKDDSTLASFKSHESDFKTISDKLEKKLNEVNGELKAEKDKHGKGKNKPLPGKVMAPATQATAMIAEAPVASSDKRSRETQNTSERERQLVEAKKDLEKALHLANGYKESYSSGVIAAQKVFTKSKEKETLKLNKKSIPTPFGSFQVLPKLGLLALAFATLLSYISFHLIILRIRGFAKVYSSAHDGRKAISPGIVAPYWLYSTNPAVKNALSWPDRQFSVAASAFALHAFWLTLAGWLVWENVRRWKSAQELLFAHSQIWIYVLVATFVIALGLAVWQFLPGKIRTGGRTFLDKVQGTHSAMPSRRAFLRIAAVGGAALILGGVYFYFRKGRGTPKQLSAQGSEFLSTTEAVWVVSDHTRVIHHTEACKRHLPPHRKGIALKESHAGYHLHPDYEIHILTALASDALAGEQYEQAITYLLRGISLHSFSYQLYDKLIGVYGKLRRYGEINSLLQKSVEDVDKQIEEMKDAKENRSVLRKRKQLERAKKEFSSRIMVANIKAERAAEKKRKAEENSHQRAGYVSGRLRSL